VKRKILVVDDHRMFRDGLKAILSHEKDMEVVGEAENGQEAIARTRELRPDIILMDVKMPVMDGVEATRRIIAEMPEVKILALSMYSGENYNTAMLRAGATGYLIKGGDIDDVTTAIRQAADSEKFQSLP
jgi:two-component system, NarL family, response regulator NreC